MTVLGTVSVFLLSAQATWMGGGSGQSPAILGIAVGAFASAAAATIYAARVRLVGAVLFLPTAVATAVLATVRPIPLVVVAAMCLAGAGNGILQSAGNASITADGTSVRLGLGFGLKQAAIPLAALADQPVALVGGVDVVHHDGGIAGGGAAQHRLQAVDHNAVTAPVRAEGEAGACGAGRVEIGVDIAAAEGGDGLFGVADQDQCRVAAERPVDDLPSRAPARARSPYTAVLPKRRRRVTPFSPGAGRAGGVHATGSRLMSCTKDERRMAGSSIATRSGIWRCSSS
jgi:hypothetical protein